MKRSFFLFFSGCALLSAATLQVSEPERLNSLGMRLVPVRAGNFMMGQERENDGLPLSVTYGTRSFLGGEVDEQPVHRVNISAGFWMSATEVTNAQYEQFDPAHRKYRGMKGLSKEDDEAVVFVNWHEAARFCQWLGRKEGKPYRLPTEAEWEYACRAGTTSRFNTGDTLPEIFQKTQNEGDEPRVVSTLVGKTPPNAWGLFDMHGNVEEWCLDWYGPYVAGPQTDPAGRESGTWKVVRGGSHNTFVRYLRSANRMSNLPEDKHWLIGFRVVQAAMSKSRKLLAEEKHLNAMNVTQKRFDWGKNKKAGPYFEGPLKYVLSPEDPAKEMFLYHNHVPSVTGCNNGDLLAAWFSCARERGRENGIVASRFRSTAGRWDTASAFFSARDRNMHGTGLFNAGDGRLLHLNGLGTDGTWSKLALLMRVSTDNGATWSYPGIADPEHSSNIPHMGMSRLKDGSIIFPVDAPGGTGLYMSKDDGRTWAFVTQNGRMNTILGNHAPVIQLKDGSLYALGRGEPLNGKMPVSQSFDGGKNWKYYPSDFPPVGGGQRCILRRLNEGPLLYVGFTDTANFQKLELNRPRPRSMTKNGLILKDAAGQQRTVYGMFAAVSLDEGKTWPFKKLISDFGTGRKLNGEAWTQNFILDEIHAEPLGYLAATQTPDNTIHLLSSGLHYRFNLEWLQQPMPAASGKAMTFFAGRQYPDSNGFENQPGVAAAEFIYNQAPFPQCHASTIVESGEGLVAAWFGGTAERNPDVGIWVSRLTPDGWSRPVEVANGIESPDKRHPCWNPVLFQPSQGPLILFYKVGPSPETWWGVMKASKDNGRTWSDAILLPKGFLGPIKNKPIELQDETILCPTSTENEGWKVHFEKFWYKSGRWEKIGPINDGKEFGAIQPSLLTYFVDDPEKDRMQILCRSRQGVIAQAWSTDRGKNWSKMAATNLPNPNSGTDAVTLSHGMQLLVYNHTTSKTNPRSREFLNVAVSRDGLNWQAALVLENTQQAEFSYPAVIQTADDMVHITYTWKRRKVKHVVIDPARLVLKPITDGKWPN